MLQHGMGRKLKGLMLNDTCNRSTLIHMYIQVGEIFLIDGTGADPELGGGSLECESGVTLNSKKTNTSNMCECTTFYYVTFIWTSFPAIVVLVFISLFTLDILDPPLITEYVRSHRCIQVYTCLLVNWVRYGVWIT